MLDGPTLLRPPAPTPQPRPLRPVALLRTLARNPLEAWTAAHFAEPVVVGGLPLARVAVISEPAAIRRVLLDNVANYEKDWLQRRVLSAGLSQGLLTAEREQWRIQRRAIAPLFSRRTVMRFSGTMAAAAQDLVTRLRRQRGRVIDMAVEATRLTLDVLERTVFSDGFGSNPEQIRRSMATYFEVIGRIGLLDLLRLHEAVPGLAARRVRRELRTFEAAVDTIVARRRRALADPRTAVPDDLMTLLLRASDPDTRTPLGDREVRANILTFIAAGHETTANCLAWSLFLLSQTPDWAARVRAEARDLDGALDDPATRLRVTRAVIDEANRLYPPIAAISRVARDADELAGTAIRRGTMVVIAPYVLHRHRTLWRHPDRFDPARFLDGGPPDRFAYLPFGAGPRTCIGAGFALQEACIVLATLVRHFEFHLAAGHAVQPVQKVTLRPAGGLPMTVRER